MMPFGHAASRSRLYIIVTISTNIYLFFFYIEIVYVINKARKTVAASDVIAVTRQLVIF